MTMEQAVHKLGIIIRRSTGVGGLGASGTLSVATVNKLYPDDFAVLAGTWTITEQINRPFY